LDGGSDLLKASTYTGQHNTEKGGHIHAPNGIRARDPSVGEVKDSACLRPRCHWDQTDVTLFDEM